MGTSVVNSGTRPSLLVILGVTIGALILVYWPILARLASDWMNDDDMGHGVFVPLVAGYILWQQKDKIASFNGQPQLLGLAIVLVGALQMIAATLGVELFLARTAFLVSLVGAVVTLGGMAFLKQLAFPLFLLIFMVPIPAIIYNQITFPLQLFASQVAEVVLGLIGIPVLREGNVLELPSQRLSVVEACSGIRSLLSLTFLSLVYGYFFESRTLIRCLLFAATIPIAILANAGRVTITGILSEYRPELAQGFFHSAEGWVIFMIALAMLVMTHGLIRGLFRNRGPARNETEGAAQ
jgi:exosortase